MVQLWRLDGVFLKPDFAAEDGGELAFALVDRTLALALATRDVPPIAIVMLHREHAFIAGLRGIASAQAELAAALAGTDAQTAVENYFTLSTFAREGGHPEIALAAAQQAFALAPDGAGPGVLESVVGGLELATGDVHAAVGHLEHARGRTKPADIQFARVTANLGRAYAALGDPRAVALLEAAIPQLETHLADVDPRRLADARFALARLVAAKDPARAHALAQGARDVYTKYGKTVHDRALAAEIDAFLRG